MNQIIDMHCDTIYELIWKQRKGLDIGLRENKLHIDLKKLMSAEYMMQNFALFVDLKEVEDPMKEAVSMAELYHKELAANKDLVAPVLCYDDIQRNRENKKISCMLTLEEGEILLGDCRNLTRFYDMGVRMITLTWNYPNQLGYPNVSLKEDGIPDFYYPDTTHGLTEVGITCVEEMERLGIIPDVSHLSDAGFYDVLTHTRKPFVASHSNSRTICPNVRNLTDHMIHCLAERGGVTGLNFCPAFLTDHMDGTEDKGTIEAIVKHAKHIVNIGGIECLGLGSDFDGIFGHAELPDASHMPLLLDALKKSGFTEDELDHITYKNVLRVYKDTL